MQEMKTYTPHYFILPAVIAFVLTATITPGRTLAATEVQASTAAPAVVKLSASGMAEAAGPVLILLTHPKSSHLLWAGTAHGGVWHSGDSGVSWQAVGESMQGMAVGALAFDLGNPDIMYAGSSASGSKQVAYQKGGMFKSEDAGASWTLLPLSNPATVGASWSNIRNIAVSNTGVLLAATSDYAHNGFIYRSTDGGKTWGILPVYAGSKVGPRNLVYKVRFDPENPNTAIFMDAYANITHSSDGGATWNVARQSSTSCK